jgi:hypothetical protein
LNARIVTWTERQSILNLYRHFLLGASPADRISSCNTGAFNSRFDIEGGSLELGQAAGIGQEPCSVSGYYMRLGVLGEKQHRCLTEPREGKQRGVGHSRSVADLAR